MPDERPDDESVESLVGRILAKSAIKPLSKEDIEERLRARLAGTTHQAEQPRRKIFDGPLISTPIVLTILFALCSGATYTVGWVTNLQSQNYEFRRDIIEIKRNRDNDIAENAKVRINYIPRVERAEVEIGKLNSENIVQNNRIENIVDSVRDFRKGSETIMIALNALQLDVAFIKASIPTRRRAAANDSADRAQSASTDR